LDGILNIHKPTGKTSYDMVAMVKRLSGERRVGHAGTLDPAASGVLPICLGRGTRVIEFLAEASKTYHARIELGVETDTYDASGRIVQRKDGSAIGLKEIEVALLPFRGLIEQTPPRYSAIKHQGRRLYELARAGIEVEPRSRPAMVYRLEILGWAPPTVTVEVECGKGTYLRSLAHDLGQSLGCGATLQELVRLTLKRR
jgi:tRNA pseudouridine55 synthase